MSGQRESLAISVAQVLRRAGVQHPLQRVIELGELSVADACIADGTPIQLDLTLEATGNALVATGTIATVARCSCRRCLDPFDQPIVTDVREIFEPRPVEGETYPLTSESIDVVPFVRDALLLALPLAPLCRPDCPGPAPELFPALVEASVDGPLGGEVAEGGAPAGDAAQPADDHDDGLDDREPAVRDPRWAALDQLRLER